MIHDRTDEALSLLEGRHDFNHMDDQDVFVSDSAYPLHQAAGKGNLKIVRAILRSGCYVDIKSPGSTILAQFFMPILTNGFKIENLFFVAILKDAFSISETIALDVFIGNQLLFNMATSQIKYPDFNTDECNLHCKKNDWKTVQ